MQQIASGTLMDVATSISGLDGCAVATEEDIGSLLTALQNPSAVVREAALRVKLK